MAHRHQTSPGRYGTRGTDGIAWSLLRTAMQNMKELKHLELENRMRGVQMSPLVEILVDLVSSRRGLESLGVHSVSAWETDGKTWEKLKVRCHSRPCVLIHFPCLFAYPWHRSTASKLLSHPSAFPTSDNLLTSSRCFVQWPSKLESIQLQLASSVDTSEIYHLRTFILSYAFTRILYKRYTSAFPTAPDPVVLVLISLTFPA